MTKQSEGQLTLEQQVRLANRALANEITLVNVDGRQMAKIGSKLLDAAEMNDWFSGLIQSLHKQGLELTEKGLGKVFRQ